jgi:poly(A) polymerase
MGSLTPAWLHWPQTQTLIKAFGDAPVRFVGGAVRDALLGRPVTDVDVATPLLPEAVMQRMEKACIRTIPTGIAHGTVTAVIDHKSFEITTLRKDVATDGRHAQVAFTDDWQVDAMRRDFTMNALYFSPQGELFDFMGGQADAQAGKVRFIGDAKTRIREDHLRILRFFRFHAHYGKGEPDSEGLAACHQLAEGILGLSGERIGHEMMRLMGAHQVLYTLGQMQECAACTFGSVELDVERLASLESAEMALLVQPAPVRRLAALLRLHDVPALVERWRLSGEVKQALSTRLAHLPPSHQPLPLLHQKALLRRIGREAFSDVALLSCAQSGAADISPWQDMLELPSRWEPPVFPVAGKDLLLLGMEEGKELGQALARLETLWEESDYTLTREELLQKR